MKLITTLLIFIIPLSLFSQSIDSIATKSPIRTIEGGIDATSFINRFLSLNDVSGFTGTYLIALKVYQKKQAPLRIGLNFLTKTTVDTDSENDGQDFKRANNSIFVSTRIGREKQRAIKGNWQLNYGYDCLLSFFTDKTKTTFTSGREGVIKSARNLIRLGGGPIAGLQYNINERMGIYTEATFYFTGGWDNDKTTFSDNTQENTGDTEFSLNTSISTPSSIIFFLKF